MPAYITGNELLHAYAHGNTVQALYKAGVRVWNRPSGITLTNLLTNGSFDTNTTGWTGSHTLARTTPTQAHDETGSDWVGRNNGNVNGTIHVQRSAAQPVTTMRVYYIRAQCRFTVAGYANVVQFYNNTTALSNGITSMSLPGVNQWGLYDGLWTANTSSLTLRLQFSGGNGNNARACEIDNVMMFDLTDTFGAANIPTIEQMRDLVATGEYYWEGAKSL